MNHGNWHGNTRNFFSLSSKMADQVRADFIQEIMEKLRFSLHIHDQSVVMKSIKREPIVFCAKIKCDK